MMLLDEGAPCESVRLAGRAKLETLARLLGLDISDPTLPGLRSGSGPNESRAIPDVLRRVTCLLVPDVMLLRKSLLRLGACVGVASSPAVLPAKLEVVEPTVRLRLRIVMEDGTVPDVRGEDLGGVLAGPGSFERAECTRASKRCICAVRVRM